MQTVRKDKLVRALALVQRKRELTVLVGNLSSAKCANWDAMSKKKVEN